MCGEVGGAGGAGVVVHNTLSVKTGDVQFGLL